VPAVTPPPQKSGCVKWGLIGCLGVILMIAVFAGVVVTIVFGTMKTTDVYRGARRSAERDPRVIQALGSPIRPGLWVSGNINVEGRRGDADITFPIHGPKGKASVHAIATKQSGTWHYAELTVTPANGSPIDLLTP